MSFIVGLRILAVASLGWVVALAAMAVLRSITGHHPLPPRVLLGEILTGLGAGALGWALLPGGPGAADDALFLGGVLLWIAGTLVQPVRKRTPEP